MKLEIWQAVTGLILAGGLGYFLGFRRAAVAVQQWAGAAFQEEIVKVLEAMELRFLRYGLDGVHEVESALSQAYGPKFEQFLKSRGIKQ